MNPMVKYKKAVIVGRSNEENRYYWGVVVCDISDFKGWGIEASHEWVKETFGIDSTSTLTTSSFEELMTNIRAHVLRYWKLEIMLPQKINHIS